MNVALYLPFPPPPGRPPPGTRYIIYEIEHLMYRKAVTIAVTATVTELVHIKFLIRIGDQSLFKTNNSKTSFLCYDDDDLAFI